MSMDALKTTTSPLVRTTGCFANDHESTRYDSGVLIECPWVPCKRSRVHSLGQRSAFESIHGHSKGKTDRFEGTALRLRGSACRFEGRGPSFTRQGASLRRHGPS